MKKSISIFAGLFFAAGLAAQPVTQTFVYTGAITTFTVPACVTSMTIEARGAQGGYNTSSTTQPGMGAIMIGTFSVTPGQVLNILVGEQPSLTTGTGNGGGGGTFVTDNTNSPLIVAGGGGGSSGTTDSPDKHGNTTTTGGTGAAGGGVGGTAGSGGSIGAAGFQSGAGGGLLTNGADGWTTNTGGLAFVNGGSGGTANAPARGGFGGGGSGSSYVVGGGGGGYSGGGSGGNSTAGVGGGGGSYNGGTSQTNTGGVNTGHGQVIITYTTGPSSPTTVTGATSVCYGDTLTLTAATVPGAITYNWSLPGSATVISGSGTNVISFVHNAAGVETASVTVTDACGTGPAATYTYTVNPQPSITLTYSPLNPCDGDTVTITASGASTYVWSTGGTNPTETFVITGNMTVYATSTDMNGCTSLDGQGIGANPNPTVTLGADTNDCSSITLDALNAGSSYLWSDNSTNQTLVVSVSGAYSVVVTDANGCEGTDTINAGIGGNFTTVGSASINFACTGEPTIMLFGSPAGGMWAGAGVFGSTFEPDTAGAGLHSLVYTYTDSLGCSGMDTITITVDLCLGTTPPVSHLQTPISLYPNPNNGTFTLAFTHSMENVIVEMVDVNGRTVFAQQYDVNAGDQKQVDLNGEANGMYLLRVTSANAVSTQRVLINR